MSCKAVPFLVPVILAAASPALAEDAAPALHARAVDMLDHAIAYKSVEKTPEIANFAAYLKGILVKSGFDPNDVVIDKSGPAPTLVATLKGASDKPAILLSGHMDVVAADPKDWTRDPFTPVEEDGYIFGRGSSDNKFGVVMMTLTLAHLKEQGFTPERDVKLVLSGDEETAMASTERLSKKLKGAAIVLNGDGGGGTLREDGEPLVYALQTAEKTYADYEVAFTNPGGHSSRPSKDNAIYHLAKALDAIAAYDFPVQTSSTTLGYFRETSKMTSGPIADAMARFAENPKDKKAIRALRAEPEYVGQLGTTCVATMLSGGHAMNALPQRAAANVNCRIFPGVDPEDVRKKLVEIIDDPQASISFVDTPHWSDGSPLNNNVLAAVTKAVHARYPDLPIVPEMSAGATDSSFFRAEGIPSYGVSGLFMKPSDNFAHGLNERIPVASIDGALEHWRILITELAGAKKE